MFKKVISLDPSYRNACSNLAAIYEQQGKRNLAIEMYQKAIELKPNDETAHLNLGIILAKTNDFKKAISLFQKTLELNPRNVPAYVNLSRILTQIKQYNAALTVLKIAYNQTRLELFKKSLEQLKANLERSNKLSLYLQSGDIDKAAKLLRKNIEKNP